MKKISPCAGICVLTFLTTGCEHEKIDGHKKDEGGTSGRIIFEDGSSMPYDDLIGGIPEDFPRMEAERTGDKSPPIPPTSPK